MQKVETLRIVVDVGWMTFFLFFEKTFSVSLEQTFVCSKPILLLSPFLFQILISFNRITSPRIPLDVVFLVEGASRLFLFL